MIVYKLTDRELRTYQGFQYADAARDAANRAAQLNLIELAERAVAEEATA